MIGKTNSILPISLAVDARKAHTITIAGDTHGTSYSARIIIDGVSTGNNGRGTDVYRFNKSDLSLAYHGHWDTYGTPSSANSVAAEIGNTTDDQICMSFCADASTKNSAINNAMQTLGGTATNTWSQSRTAYCFIGVRGAGSGKAIYRDAGGDAQSPQWSGVLLPNSLLGYQNYTGDYVGLNSNGVLTKYTGNYQFFGY